MQRREWPLHWQAAGGCRWLLEVSERGRDGSKALVSSWPGSATPEAACAERAPARGYILARGQTDWLIRLGRKRAARFIGASKWLSAGHFAGGENMSLTRAEGELKRFTGPIQALLSHWEVVVEDLKGGRKWLSKRRPNNSPAAANIKRRREILFLHQSPKLDPERGGGRSRSGARSKSSGRDRNWIARGHRMS